MFALYERKPPEQFQISDLRFQIGEKSAARGTPTNGSAFRARVGRFQMTLLRACQFTTLMEHGDGMIGLRGGEWPTFSPGSRPRAEQAPPLQPRNLPPRTEATESDRFLAESLIALRYGLSLSSLGFSFFCLSSLDFCCGAGLSGLFSAGGFAAGGGGCGRAGAGFSSGWRAGRVGCGFSAGGGGCGRAGAGFSSG